ncbi:hypothetical protein ACLBW0_19365 [Enterobacteriaceae bacterium C34A]
MTVNRSIFAFIKSPLTLLFIGGFVAAFGAYALHSIYNTPLKSQCVAPISFYAIQDDTHAVLTRGVYRTYRAGINEGRVTFIGSIAHFGGTKELEPPIPVQREVTFDASFSGNLLHMVVTGQHRRIGDQSSDQDVKDFVFPQIGHGDTSNTFLYLLDGKVLATGTETVPRVACIN